MLIVLLEPMENWIDICKVKILLRVTNLFSKSNSSAIWNSFGMTESSKLFLKNYSIK